MKKIFTLSVAALFATMVSSQTIKILPGGYQALAISDNGKYVSGNSEAYSSFIWDWQNDKVVEDAENLPEGSAEGVADNGVASVSTGDEGATFGIDGKIAKLPLAEGYPMSLARSINADGTVVAGCVFNESYMSHACVWKNGEIIALTEPTTEEIGFEVNGTQAIDISADGKTVIGFVVDNMAVYPFIVWHLGDDGKYVLDMVCKDYFNDGMEYTAERPYTMFYPTGISANGKWVALQVELWGGDWDYSEVRMARFNLETKQMEIAVIDGTESIEANQAVETGRITNDGTMLGYTSVFGMVGREGLIWKAGESQPKLLRNVCKLKALEDYDLMANTPVDITPDGKYIIGFGVTGAGDFESYVIDTTAESTAIDAAETETGESVTSMYDLTGKAVPAGAVCNKGVYVVKTVKNGKVSTRKVIK